LRGRAQGAPTLLGFGGNAWNARVTALTLHRLFPDHDVVVFHYRGYAPSSGRPSARALLSASLVIFDYLRRARWQTSRSWWSGSASALGSPPISLGIDLLRG
jgi:hypothetical protein